MPGALTSQAEVTHVSMHGLWLLLGDEELFLSFADFPWFKDATIGELCNIEYPTDNHLYWPSLDVDLAVESIRNPSAFPLVSATRAQLVRHALNGEPAATPTAQGDGG